MSLDNDIVSIVAGELYTCAIKEDIENVFNRYNITDDKQKIDCLKACMEETAIYYHGGDKNEDISISYQRYLTIFIWGAWRLVHSKNA